MNTKKEGQKYITLTQEDIQVLLTEGVLGIPDPSDPEGDFIQLQMEEDE